MSKEYSIPKETKREAEWRAREIGVKPNSIHHICTRSLAKKYRLPNNKITSIDNAIALEQPFHEWIHGKQIDLIDEALDWKGFEEEDYIFLAGVLLGIPESAFDEGNICKPRTNRKRKRKSRKKKKRWQRY